MDKQELLDKYFENNLTDSERKAFDALLSTDADFREDFEFQKQLKHTIAVSERQKLKQQLREIDFSERTTHKRKQYLAIAAILVVSLAVSVFFLADQKSEQQLYASFFQAYPNVIEVNTRTAKVSRATSVAFQAYENENYDKALEAFSHLNQSDQALYGNFYRGVCYLALKKTDPAIRLLNIAQSSKNTQIAKAAVWYQALAYLQDNNAQSARVLLLQIAADNTHPQHNLAKELLTDL